MMVGGLALQQLSQLYSTPLDNPALSSEQRSRVPSSSGHLSLHQVRTIGEFKQVHAQFIKLGLDENPRQVGELLSACALSEWGSMEYASSIFLEIDDPGTFDFNTMIRAHVRDSNAAAALLLYIEMMEYYAVIPDNFTFPFLLKACAQLSGITEGVQIHGHCVKFGFDSDVYINNTLIHMYGKCGEIMLSSKVFDQMGSNRTVASWSALLAAHTRMGLWSDCLQLFGTMSGDDNWRADESTMVSTLTSCANLGALDLGRSIHCSLLRKFGTLNVIVQTSLIDMYTKCGQLEKGQAIFDQMSEKNVWTYSVMISGLAMHGDGEGALRVFWNMLEKGLEPDEAIFVGVLSACSHAGLIEEGIQFFDRMRFEHQITPTIQHYGCMVDLMARAGRLEAAYEIIQGMPMKPHDAAWRSLLSACKVHGNLELAEIASRNLVKLDLCNTGDYVILSNIYARAYRWGDAAKARTKILDKGMNQVPGYSRVGLKGQMHTFVSHDKSHPQSDEIYEMLYQMEWQLKFEGYSPDTSQVVADVDEEEKRVMVRGHSQKLAIAYALLNTSHGSTIRIFTNLRMSNECHAYTALISEIFEREIVVRDRQRFHCFREGRCSCRGHW